MNTFTKVTSGAIAYSHSPLNMSLRLILNFGCSNIANFNDLKQHLFN